MDSSATILAFCGETSLRTAAVELLRLAGEAQHAAEAVRIPCQDVAAAAAELSQADDSMRIQAVFSLHQASTALERDAVARQGALRRGASNLERVCRRLGHRSTNKVLLDLAHGLWCYADGVGVPCDGLVQAARALLLAGADDAARAQVIPALAMAATALERAAGSRLAVLGCAAANLAVQCQEYRWVADNIPALRRAAEAARARQMAARAQQREEPTAASLWSWRRFVGRRQRMARSNLEEPLLLSDSTPPPDTTADEQDCTQVDTVGLALSCALNLPPSMGEDGILKGATEDYIWWVSLVFSLGFGAIALGLPVGMHGGCLRRFFVEYTRLCRHVATLGMTLLVCFYCYWLLTPGSDQMLITQCVVFSVLNAIFWIGSGWYSVLCTISGHPKLDLISDINLKFVLLNS